MKGRDVETGGRYLVKVSGSVVPVRVTGESRHGGWDAVNETTGRTIRVRSPQRFRPLAERTTTTPLHEEVPPVTAQDREEIRRRRDATARRRLAEDNDRLIHNPKETPMTTTTPSRAAAETAAASGAALETALISAVKKAVKGVERVDAKSGSYFRLRLGSATLAYVNPSKKGLILDLGTPKDKVPAGVAVKPGPNATLPIKFRVDAAADVDVATTLLKIAAEAGSAAKPEPPAEAEPPARRRPRKAAETPAAPAAA